MKCGGEHPICNRCKARKDVCIYKLWVDLQSISKPRSDHISAPTLSYTQKLESRIVDLEKALQQANQTVTSQSPRNISSSSPHSSVPGAEPGSAFGSAFKGLAVDARGSITHYGATSFFQLPSAPRPVSQDDNTTPVPVQIQTESGKEKLVQNAWEQRALEVLSETPVGI